MNVFLDTNVLIDVFLERNPFLADSQKVWFLAERGRIKGFVSALTFPNIFYVARRLRGPEAAGAMMTMLRDTFVPVSLDAQILNQAIDAGFSDFEDAIQYFSALRADVDCLLTRNPSHFPVKNLAVLTPEDFLAAHQFE